MGSWPFAFGVSLAWLISSLPLATPIHHARQFKAGAAQLEDTTASRIIEERNVLRLDNPLPQAATSGPDPRNWKLLGVFASTRPMVLLLMDGKSKAVKMDDVENGWTLTEVTSNSATFKAGSQERILSLFKEAQKATISKGTTNKIVVSKTEIVPVLKDPGALLQQALFKPNMENGKTNGYRISNIQDNTLLSRLGFQNGDVLIRINGDAIDGPAKMMQLYSGLQSAQAVNMDIKRGGDLISLVVELN